MSGHWLRHTFLAPRPNSLVQSSTTDEYAAVQFYLGLLHSIEVTVMCLAISKK